MASKSSNFNQNFLNKLDQVQEDAVEDAAYPSFAVIVKERRMTY